MYFCIFATDITKALLPYSKTIMGLILTWALLC